MDIWMGYIVLVSLDSVFVYSKPSFDDGPKHVETLQLQLPDLPRSINISSQCSSPSACWFSGHSPACTVLDLIIQDSQCMVHIAELSCRIDTTYPDDRHFSLVLNRDVFQYGSRGLGDGSQCPYIISAGSSGAVTHPSKLHPTYYLW